ncbi:MxaK protein [Sphaerotilus mobilis]|uniref:MxaK protein n=1 Tax=Sphaerotilus mobilis TaxID=47994 RepID=A0A4V2EXA1_9BURK|nr:MxaK protein [Sphaerotilus mobilis]RZS58770.1 mxaK protein [Sphaerotilus mobilis]
MKRRTLHLLFALAALVATLLLVVQTWRLRQHQALDAAISRAAQSSKDAAALDSTLRDAPREVRLARATALARAGEHEAATRLYSGLIEPGQVDAVGRAALFDLGNLHLRQALASATPANATEPATSPLVELAKQRYRDLLRLAPDDWDARHNLERALRLSPEQEEAVAEPDNEPVERRNVQLRGMKAGDLP